MIDERTEELAALHAFDLVEGPELADFSRRLEREPALRRIVDDLRETASACAFVAPAVTPSAGLRDRVLATCATTPRTGPASQRSESDAHGGGGGDNVTPFSLPAWTGWAAAAVFALLAAYLGFTASRLDYQLALLTESEALAALQARSLDTALESERIVSKEQTLRLKTAEQRVAALDTELAQTRSAALAQIAELKAQADLAALKIATLNSLLGNAPDATAVAVWNPFSQEGVLTVSQLPALAPDKDYQLWVVDPQYSIPVDGGVFTVDAATGEARFQFKADKPVDTIAKFAVSLERKGGVPKAEGPMVLISP